MERRTDRMDYRPGGWAEIQYLGERRDGLWTVYRRDGSKDWERENVAGHQNGYERRWDEAGRLTDEKWFLNGELHGTWCIWDSSGILRQISTFVCGEQEGLQCWWDEAGNVIAEGWVAGGLHEATFVVEVFNAAETATKRMVAEWRGGQMVTDLHWE